MKAGGVVPNGDEVPNADPEEAGGGAVDDAPKGDEGLEGWPNADALAEEPNALDEPKADPAPCCDGCCPNPPNAPTPVD
jgi:hypothetical protein